MLPEDLEEWFARPPPAWQQWLVTHEWARRVEAGEVITSHKTQPAEMLAVLRDLVPRMDAAEAAATAAVELFHGERFDVAAARLAALLVDPAVASLALLATVQRAAKLGNSRAQGKRASGKADSDAMVWALNEWDRRPPGTYANKLAFADAILPELVRRFGKMPAAPQIAADWIEGKASRAGSAFPGKQA